MKQVIIAAFIYCCVAGAPVSAQGMQAERHEPPVTPDKVSLQRIFLQQHFADMPPVNSAATAIRYSSTAVLFGIVILLLTVMRTCFIWRWHKKIGANVTKTKIAEARLKALHTPVNPLFIQQSLAKIGTLIQNNPGGTQAVTAMRAISVYLRQAIAISGASTTTLESELEFTELYLFTKQMILPGGFDFNIMVTNETDTVGISVPVMLLQPVLECCISCMAIPGGGKGNISIQAAQQGHQLTISIHNQSPVNFTFSYAGWLQYQQHCTEVMESTAQRLQLSAGPVKKNMASLVTVKTIAGRERYGCEWEINIPVPPPKPSFWFV